MSYSRTAKKYITIIMNDASSLDVSLDLKIETHNEDTDKSTVGLNCSNMIVLVGLLQQSISKFFEGEVISEQETSDEDEDDDDEE
jgi:hypothetical protein